MGMDAPALEEPSGGQYAGRLTKVRTMENTNKKKITRFFLFIAGFGILILGITLILQWWAYLSVIVKGAAGIVLALTGLVILAIAKE